MLENLLVLIYVTTYKKNPLFDSQSDREFNFSNAILPYIKVVLKPLEVIKYFYFIVAMGSIPPKGYCFTWKDLEKSGTVLL